MTLRRSWYRTSYQAAPKLYDACLLLAGGMRPLLSTPQLVGGQSSSWAPKFVAVWSAVTCSQSSRPASASPAAAAACPALFQCAVFELTHKIGAAHLPSPGVTGTSTHTSPTTDITNVALLAVGGRRIVRGTGLQSDGSVRVQMRHDTLQGWRNAVGHVHR